jgi:hypothetical protein
VLLNFILILLFVYSFHGSTYNSSPINTTKAG